MPLGLSQIVGGQAVFGSMTVAENLQMYGFTLGRDKAAVEAGIEAAFEVFPRLADRRNQLASTLSGGEQQMLGLSKALMLKPKVLMVDEFSLGLAPVVVGELLVLVRRLNAEGTAILLVEQSVNVALTLVDRVYFMEKGRIVHEGLASEPAGPPRPRRGAHPGRPCRPFGGGQRMSLLTGFDLSLARLLLGLFTGLIYGLLAVGLVLVFRASRFINFAQGAIGVFGAAVLGVLVDASSECRTGSRSSPRCSPVPASRLSPRSASSDGCRRAPKVLGMVATLGLSQFLLVFALRHQQERLVRRELPPAAGLPGVRARRPARHLRPTSRCSS